MFLTESGEINEDYKFRKINEVNGNYIVFYFCESENTELSFELTLRKNGQLFLAGKHAKKVQVVNTSSSITQEHVQVISSQGTEEYTVIEEINTDAGALECLTYLREVYSEVFTQCSLVRARRLVHHLGYYEFTLSL